MNRTDRLYALVEELRAVAPRPRSARWLAGRFEVSARTVERDLMAWCRLRGAVRAFRTDRISSVAVTAEVPAPRVLRREDLDIPADALSQLTDWLAG